MNNKLQILRRKPWFKIASNKFVLATLGFIIWMSFLDVNSLIIHRELNQEIEDLNSSIEYYKKEIEKDQQQLEELSSDPEKLEKFAREQHWMKRKGEIIYLID